MGSVEREVVSPIYLTPYYGTGFIVAIMIESLTKVVEINQKIRDLKKMKQPLERLMKCCDDRTVLLSDCPVLECFMEDQ